MTTAWAEYAARLFEPPPPPRWPTPGDLARAIEPATVQTPALDLIDDALVDVEAGRCDRLIISLPPQEGKSTRVTKTGPLWFLTRNPDRRIVIVSFQQELADEFGREVRNYITSNSGEDDTLDLGLRIAPDNGAVSRWRLADHRGGVRSVGLSGGLTGRPADVLFIDDPISNMEQATSKTYRDRAWSFWTSVGSTRLAPGAPVVLILTRWHEDDLAGRLLAAQDGHRWRVINIPAQCEDPDMDPLGRAAGEYLQSSRGRTVVQWEQIKIQSGSRVWASLYQGRPSPQAGDLFHREHWQTYNQPLWLERDDGSRVVPGADGHKVEVLTSWDLTFKDSSTSDFVVGQVWLRRGADAYLLDQVRGRWDFPETVRQFQTLAARWPDAILKLVEDKANGPALIAALRHSVPGIVPEEPQGSKYARASAITPLIEAGNVHLPSPALAPWVGDLIEEAAAFPNGAHDDQVDALSQALNRLVLQPLLAGDDRVLDQDDVLDDNSDFMAGFL